MMADDSVIRVLFGKNKNEVLEALNSWVKQTTDQNIEQAQKIAIWWRELTAMLADASKEEGEMKARSIMTRLVDIVQGSLLIADYLTDHDDIARLVMDSWFLEKSIKLTADSMWKEQARSDMNIVFGHTDLGRDRARL